MNQNVIVLIGLVFKGLAMHVWALTNWSNDWWDQWKRWNTRLRCSLSPLVHCTEKRELKEVQWRRDDWTRLVSGLTVLLQICSAFSWGKNTTNAENEVHGVHVVWTRYQSGHSDSQWTNTTILTPEALCSRVRLWQKVVHEGLSSLFNRAVWDVHGCHSKAQALVRTQDKLDKGKRLPFFLCGESPFCTIYSRSFSSEQICWGARVSWASEK